MTSPYSLNRAYRMAHSGRDHRSHYVHDGRRRDNIREQSVEHHWKVVPPRVREFIMGRGHLSEDGYVSNRRLINFWSSPQNVDLASRVDICGAAWYLALIYLRKGALEEAKALMINGAFIHQCINTSIEYVKILCSSDASRQQIMKRLNYMTQGFYATESPEQMISHIQRYIPPEYLQSMTTYGYATLTSKKDFMGFVDQISDDYNFTKNSEKYAQGTRASCGTRMQLVFVDDDAVDGNHRHHALYVSSSATLKMAFLEYAERRGVSMRSLRFSFAGRALFPSQVGKRTPRELGMHDRDVVVVHRTDASVGAEGTEGQTLDRVCEGASNRAKPKRHGKSSKKKKANGRGEDESTRQDPTTTTPQTERTQEELRIDHSKALTRVHEELQPRLKDIRRRLNNLLLERTRPKDRSAGECSGKAPPPTGPRADTPCCCAIRPPGKAGRPSFDVLVGEVQHLHKTGKAAAAASRTPTDVPPLDLHGCTRTEALARLDKGLEGWVDAAMRGSYPFVVRATIVCGCGSQVLREAVEGWIRSKRNVSNAPKRR